MRCLDGVAGRLRSACGSPRGIEGGALPNFAGPATPESVRPVYDGPTLGRLGSPATSYDPDAVLACGQAVRTAAK